MISASSKRSATFLVWSRVVAGTFNPDMREPTKLAAEFIAGMAIALKHPEYAHWLLGELGDSTAMNDYLDEAIKTEMSTQNIEHQEALLH